MPGLESLEVKTVETLLEEEMGTAQQPLASFDLEVIDLVLPECMEELPWLQSAEAAFWESVCQWLRSLATFSCLSRSGSAGFHCLGLGHRRSDCHQWTAGVGLSRPQARCCSAAASGYAAVNARVSGSGVSLVRSVRRLATTTLASQIHIAVNPLVLFCKS